MEKKHDIKQRALDGKWVVWTQVDDPEADLDYYRKSGLPIPQRWVPIAVENTEEDARAASRRDVALSSYRNRIIEEYCGVR